MRGEEDTVLSGLVASSWQLKKGEIFLCQLRQRGAILNYLHGLAAQERRNSFLWQCLLSIGGTWRRSVAHIGKSLRRNNAN